MQPQIMVTNLYPHHICIKSEDDLFFTVDRKKLYQVFLDELAFYVHRRKLLVHSFVLMANHVHLIATVTEGEIDQFIWRLIDGVEKRIQKKMFSRELSYQLLKSQTYLNRAYRYVYLNPVRANLCTRAEHYPYSTLNGEKLPFDLIDRFKLYYGTRRNLLHHLNLGLTEGELSGIKNLLAS